MSPTRSALPSTAAAAATPCMAGEASEVLAPPVDERMLALAVSRITREFPDACVLLFGSHAYGTPRADSDVDLLVIASTQGGVFEAAGRVYAALHPREISIDVVFLTPELFRRRRGGFDPFIQEVIARGRVLHGKLP